MLSAILTWATLSRRPKSSRLHSELCRKHGVVNEVASALTLEAMVGWSGKSSSRGR
jgi:hypothetical protein